MNCNFLNLTPKDINTTYGFIALFDILGYRDWIKVNTVEKIAIDQKNMKRMITTNVESQLNYALQKDIIKILSYADTFLIYTNEISDTGFQTIMHACRGMFEAAICFALPIRGTVTCGEFYACEDMLTGKPLLEAFEKEKAQDWIGCWISDVCFEKISDEEKLRCEKDKIIARYAIPFKNRTVKEVYAYNWADHAIQNPQDIDLNFLIEKSFLKKPQTHGLCKERKIRNKIRNTIAFYNFIKSTKR
jgi:hypothetical protein